MNLILKSEYAPRPQNHLDFIPWANIIIDLPTHYSKCVVLYTVQHLKDGQFISVVYEFIIYFLIAHLIEKVFIRHITK